MPKKRKKRKPRVKNPIDGLNTKLDLVLKAISSLEEETVENRKVFCDTVDNLQFSLKKSSDINTNVEDTLLNVLLAIRQNEYLQAWYPVQHGNTEMKVVGSYSSNMRVHG